MANEGCRFNYANQIEIGDNVSWNAGCYIDSKGGVKFGDFAMLTEYVKIFSHSHSEHDHMQREYNGVEIGPYAKCTPTQAYCRESNSARAQWLLPVQSLRRAWTILRSYRVSPQECNACANSTEKTSKK